jgi:hypothetical protein
MKKQGEISSVRTNSWIANGLKRWGDVSAADQGWGYADRGSDKCADSLSGYIHIIWNRSPEPRDHQR